MSENKKDNYQIISLIGQGAYGQVYKGRRKYTGQFVAIKSIKKKGKQEKDIKVMRDEIEILKKLKHQNIILLLDSFETNSQFILVTELGQGELFNIIEDDQSLEEAEIRKIAQQLVRALHYIHSNRITHRDMKPQNILMTSDGIIKLCDFGFARHMSYKTEVLTSLKGTPLYMAPQVVKQQPYNHTADLWSLGVILYELATGNPPFTAPNLITLVEHISKDPIVYPDYIAGQFKSFLKGLLNKDPKKRLGWPQLLNHPFIRQTEQEKLDRKKKNDRFSSWVEDNHCINQQEEPPAALAAHSYSKSISQNGFQERSRDISPKKQTSSVLGSNDPIWNKYYTTACEQKGATALRSDPAFLDNLLKVLEININQIMRVRDKKNLLHCALKVLIQILMTSKVPQNKKFDNSKNLNIPNHLLTILKGLLKVEGNKQYIDLMSDITKLIGLLSRSSFNKNFGIEMVYVRSFVPLMPLLVKSATQGNDSGYQSFVTNLLKTTGIFANNASANYIRSFSFYKDLVEKRFIQQCMQITKTYYDQINILKLFVQVISAFMHPMNGEIEHFPWRAQSYSGIQEYKQCSTMLECVRQTIINSLIQSNFGQLFEKILSIQDESALLPKVSVNRITLQAIRQSKEFTEHILFQQKNIIKYIFLMLASQDPIVYATACQIISYLIKYSKEKKKEKVLQPFLVQYLPIILMKFKQITKGVINTFGSLAILQQTLSLQNSHFFNKILQQIEGDKNFFRVIGQLMSYNNHNHIQQMKKIEGSNYGVHAVGLYDNAFLFMHRFIIRISKEHPKKTDQIIKILKQHKIQSKLSQVVCNLTLKTGLSPRGLISLLMCLFDLMSLWMCQEFLDERFLQSLIILIKEQQIQALLQWPINYGGGEVCISTMFGNLMKIFLVYLQHAENYPGIIKNIFNHKLLQLVINFTKHLNNETIGSVIPFILHLMSTQKGDMKESIKQFIHANGMSLFVRFQLLKSSQQNITSIIESCNLLSMISRLSKDYYEHIDSIEPYEDIKRLISHPDPQIRSRVINLIGNMCRHSNFFYKKLNSFGILRHCITLCEDQDKNIKKFACVAIGNASFHDDSLYQSLRTAIPILVNLLKDSDEKIRSNAAAALGNLARNSPLLDKDFINTGANYQLVNLMTQDKSIAAKKVSTMAIINLLDLPESKKVLLSLQISKILQKMLLPPLSNDTGLAKSAQKALDKLK